MEARWKPGTVVVQEGVNPRGKLIEVRPAIVTEDSDRCLALFFPAGSTWLNGDWMNGRSRYNLSLEERVREFSSTEPLTCWRR
jgi:hypothetical protein